jgi:uncharacterized phage-associated protein
MFNEKKITQMAAYLLHQRGGQMSHLKLMKLLYLTDRKSLIQFGYSMSDDRMVSMRNGPVLSMALDLMNGGSTQSTNGWGSLISAKENYELSLAHDIDIHSLDELSKSDVEVLDQVWDEFGSMTRWDLVAYTHDNCPEWEDPNGSSNPIPLEQLFTAIGRSEDEATSLATNIREHRYVDEMFATA